MKRLVVIAMCVVIALMSAAGVRAGGPADEVLASHPEVLQGQLANGVRYVVRRHGVPSGGLTVCVAVRAGTLHEEDAQRGSARLVERLAIARATKLAEGSLEAAGVRIDRDLTSWVGFDRTQYSISVSSVDEAEAREVLRLMASMVGGVQTEQEELDRQRRIVAEQERAAAGATLRLNASLFPLLAPGSRMATRLPEATGAAVWGLDAETVQAFAKRWYVAPAMQVVVVGDVDAGVMVGAVTEAFARVPSGGTRGFPDAGIGAAATGTAIVESDGELTGDVVELVTLDHRMGAVKTTGSLRAQAVEDLAMRALAARLEDRIGEGELASARMTALAADLSAEVRAWMGLSRGAAGTWDAQLERLVAEIRRAVAQGFTPGELEAARKVLIGAARAEAEQEATQDGAMLAARYCDVIATGWTLMSGRQKAAALEAIFDRGVSEEEVRAVTMVRMDPQRAAVLVLLPEGVERPSTERVMSVVRGALERPLEEAGGDVAVATCMVDHTPEEGEIRELTMDNASGVVTANLGSGVRVHHRKVVGSGSRVFIAASIEGGLLEGDAALRARTRAIEALLRLPSGGGRSSAEVRRLLAGKDIKLSGQVLDNRVMIAVSAPSAEAETAMQLLHTLLTRPELERAAFERWREQSKQIAEMRSVQAWPVAQESMLEALLPPGERRLMALSADEAMGVTYEEAVERIEAIVRSPMDVAITGDIELKSALRLAAVYVATLESRAPVSRSESGDGLCAGTQCVAVSVDRSIQTPNAEQAVVLSGFRGADLPGSVDGLSLSVMAEVAAARLNAEVRDRLQLSPGVGVASRPNEMFRGSGQFWALAVCDPQRVDEVATAIETSLEELRRGASDEEIAAARARVKEQAERELLDAGEWAEELASMGRRGRTAMDFAEMAERVEKLEPQTIRERYRALAAPERRVRVIVSPAVR